MSNFGYYQRMRSERASDMRRKHPSAYIVLDTIAEHAKFQEDDKQHPFLDYGESIITAELCGVSKDQFSRALKYLENEGDILVLHRGRKDGDSEFMARIQRELTRESNANQMRINPRVNQRVNLRINGTVVKLLSSDIYNVNLMPPTNQLANQLANQMRINPRQIVPQTRNKEDKKIKNICKEQQQKEPAAPVVVFPCLEKIDCQLISQIEKINLTRKYQNDEQTVIDAVAAVTHPSHNPQESFLKSLRAACKHKWKPPKDKEDCEKINKREAQRLKKSYKGIYTIELLNKGVEIITGGNGTSKMYLYDMPIEKFKSEIKEFYSHKKG